MGRRGKRGGGEKGGGGGGGGMILILILILILKYPPHTPPAEAEFSEVENRKFIGWCKRVPTGLNGL